MATIRHKAKRDPEASTGHPDMDELHPLITYSPQVMGGHAHLKGTRCTVERVLRALAAERQTPLPSALTVFAGRAITAADVEAALLYAAHVTENMHSLYAEMRKRLDARNSPT